MGWLKDGFTDVLKKNYSHNFILVIYCILSLFFIIVVTGMKRVYVTEKDLN
jgi:hypothetical protein